MLVIAVEALAQHLVGIAHDEKGGGVGLLYRPLQGHDLLLLEGAHEHVFCLPGPGPGPPEDGDAPVQLRTDGADDLLGSVADDIGHLGVVQAVEHPVDDQGGDIQGDQPVQGAAQAVEGQSGQGDDHQVHRHDQGAHGQMAEAELQQPGDEIGAAGGGSLEEHHPKGQPDQRAAEDGGQHGVHGREGVTGGQQVHPQGGGGGGEEGGGQQLPPQQPPAQQEQGQVEGDDRTAHRDGGDDGMDDLPQASHPAQGDLVGNIAPVKAQSKDSGGQCDPQIGPEGGPELAGAHKKTSFPFLVGRRGGCPGRWCYSRVICSSPRSGSRRRAPAMGRERAR